MCKSKRELAQEQLDLMNHIRHYANVNMVTCGHCGTILLHNSNKEFDKEPLVCFSCKTEFTDASDCPDYWYEGIVESSEFDEEDEEEVYLGNIEKGITNLKVYGIDYGYRLKFYTNDIERAVADCLDSDHVYRELEVRGYKKSFRKVVLSML